MDIALVRAVEKLRHLPVAALQNRYHQLLGQESRCAHKEYLLRRVAWQLQAQSEGGLSEQALSRIAEVGNSGLGSLSVHRRGSTQPNVVEPHSTVRAPGRARDSRIPPAGALLRRRYQGGEVLVRVLETGFEYQSRRYHSLSAIAREVTGTRWNGLLFFGLTERRHG